MSSLIGPNSLDLFQTLSTNCLLSFKLSWLIEGISSSKRTMQMRLSLSTIVLRTLLQLPNRPSGGKLILVFFSLEKENERKKSRRKKDVSCHL